MSRGVPKQPSINPARADGVSGEFFTLADPATGRAQLILGNGLGFTSLQHVKSDASAANWLDLRTGGAATTNRRWLGIWNTTIDNDVRLSRRDAVGAFVENVFNFEWATGEAQFTSARGSNATRVSSNLGTALGPGDFALSAGWGATAALIVGAGSTDARGFIDITANGAGLAANATVTLTFADGAYPVAPVVVVCRGDVVAPSAGDEFRATAFGAASVTFTFTGLPVAANVYRVVWHTLG